MKLLTLNSQGIPEIGLMLKEDKLLNLSNSSTKAMGLDYSPTSVRQILEYGEECLDAMDQFSTLELKESKQSSEIKNILSLKEVDTLAPIYNPKLILSVGLNYWKHLEEMAGTPVPKNPTAFIKTRASLLGSGSPIKLPPQCPDMVDFEGELCVVIGKPCHNISAESAMDYIAGYTIANDVSARDWVQEVFAAEGTFPAIQAWERNISGKQLPGFTPCGPVLVTKDEIPSPNELYMETRVNGKVMQSTNTNDMIFKIPELISYFSKWYSFCPGDIITTGSPAGVGFGREPKVFLKPGDVVEVEVEGVGILSNPVV